MAAALFDEGPFAPCPARFNMAAHTFAAAAAVPDKPALLVVDGPGAPRAVWSHGALARAVRRTAAGLARAGLRRGDRVLLRLGNSADFPLAFFGANALGAVPVPCASLLTAPEVAAILADLDPAAIVHDPSLPLPEGHGRRVLVPGDLDAGTEEADFADTAADDPAYIVYTSGTGGRPKGVLHAQRAAWARRMMWRGWYGLTAEDRMLHAGAFNWTFTLGAGLTDPWAIGATALIYAGPPDRTVWPRLAAAHGATLFAGAPGVYRQMLEAPALGTGFAGLRHGLSAGETLPAAVSDAWTAATGKPIFEALGMSEVSTYLSFSPESPAGPGRAGRPQPGRRVAILGDAGGVPLERGADGLLAVGARDPGLMLGYWRRPEETAAAFRGDWFLTGDRARMEADGTITYLGRADDLLNAGGFRVAPQEVEAALLAHPGIADAGVADYRPRDGVSVIAAWYVPAAAALSEADLAAHCAARLARYKCPRAFFPVADLPRGANGKLNRRQLAAPEG